MLRGTPYPTLDKQSWVTFVMHHRIRRTQHESGACYGHETIIS